MVSVRYSNLNLEDNRIPDVLTTLRHSDTLAIWEMTLRSALVLLTELKRYNSSSPMSLLWTTTVWSLMEDANWTIAAAATPMLLPLARAILSLQSMAFGRIADSTSVRTSWVRRWLIPWCLLLMRTMPCHSRRLNSLTLLLISLSSATLCRWVLMKVLLSDRIAVLLVPLIACQALLLPAGEICLTSNWPTPRPPVLTPTVTTATRTVSATYVNMVTSLLLMERALRLGRIVLSSFPPLTSCKTTRLLSTV